MCKKELDFLRLQEMQEKCRKNAGKRCTAWGQFFVVVDLIIVKPF